MCVVGRVCISLWVPARARTRGVGVIRRVGVILRRGRNVEHEPVLVRDEEFDDFLRELVFFGRELVFGVGHDPWAEDHSEVC